jgi:exonuclease III
MSDTSTLCNLKIASINMDGRQLTHAAALIDQYPEDIDILCLQDREVTKKLGTNMTISLIEGRDTSDLATFNKSAKMQASAAFLTPKAAILILNENITVREAILNDRLVIAKLALEHPLSPESPENGPTNPRHATVVCAYAPAKTQKRKPFLSDELLPLIRDLTMTSNEHLILAGDLNDFQYIALDRFPVVLEREEGHSSTRLERERWWPTILTPAFGQYNMTDGFRFLHPTRKEYSRLHYDKEKTLISATRIDHIIISEHLLVSLKAVKYVPTGFSDRHAAIAYLNEGPRALDFNEEEREENQPRQSGESLVGPGAWKLYPSALTERQFCRSSQNYAEQLVSAVTRGQACTVEMWEEIKKRLRSHAIALSIPTGHKRKQPGKRMTEIQQKLVSLDIRNKSDRHQIPSLMSELQRYHMILIMDDRRRSGRSLIASTVQPNKTRYRRKHFIMELQSAELEETPKKDVKGKGLIVQQFYQKLFSVSTTFEPELADALLAMTPPDKLLLPLPREILALPFTENELKEALEQCGSGSAPGIDGLPFEFWKNIKESVLKAFTETCNDMANNGRTVEWPVLIGSLLHKKGDRKFLNHYRLLSILDSDLRWRAKAILTKLMTHCEHFISEQQTAFFKNRQISDNVMAVMLAIEETRIYQKEGMILALDQEKAYDKVRWDWMFRVLEYIGVPDEMIKTIKASYKGPVVRISVNKHLNPNLAFERGVLQGDPLSVLLYIITIQPLLYGLSNKGIGIQVSWEEKTATLSSMAHADDLIVFIANEIQYDDFTGSPGLVL